MTPREPDERFSEWVDGRMSAKARERFEAELRVNPRLQAEAEQFRAMVRKVQLALQRPTGSVDLADRIIAAVQREPQRPAREVPRPWLRPLLFATSLAAAAMVAVLLFQERTPPGELVAGAPADSFDGVREAKDRADEERLAGKQSDRYAVTDRRNKAEAGEETEMAEVTKKEVARQTFREGALPDLEKTDAERKVAQKAGEPLPEARLRAVPQQTLEQQTREQQTFEQQTREPQKVPEQVGQVQAEGPPADAQTFAKKLQSPDGQAKVDRGVRQQEGAPRPDLPEVPVADPRTGEQIQQQQELQQFLRLDGNVFSPPAADVQLHSSWLATSGVPSGSLPVLVVDVPEAQWSDRLARRQRDETPVLFNSVGGNRAARDQLPDLTLLKDQVASGNDDFFLGSARRADDVRALSELAGADGEVYFVSGTRPQLQAVLADLQCLNRGYRVRFETITAQQLDGQVAGLAEAKPQAKPAGQTAGRGAGPTTGSPAGPATGGVKGGDKNERKADPEADTRGDVRGGAERERRGPPTPQAETGTPTPTPPAANTPAPGSPAPGAPPTDGPAQAQRPSEPSQTGEASRRSIEPGAPGDPKQPAAPVQRLVFVLRKVKE